MNDITMKQQTDYWMRLIPKIDIRLGLHQQPRLPHHCHNYGLIIELHSQWLKLGILRRNWGDTYIQIL